ncbi:MAG: hydroxyethylthiazole kinase [Lachnospiraceae bacterium]|nr:hydroxyethylthiazole kinase [Lachnospiraceae bacterium]
MDSKEKTAERIDSALIRDIREEKPLVHAITNPVTMTDVVNLILASGATAICADDPKEAEDISSISDVTLLNIGMPSERKMQAMLLAGGKANELGHPLLLDPVGAGASAFRKEILEKLLNELHPTCIRGNQSEMAALMGLVIPSRGVEDAGLSLDPKKLQSLARKLNTVLAVTGETDYAISPNQILEIQTGTPLLKRITGSGCMLSGFLAASIGAYYRRKNPEDSLHSDAFSIEDSDQSGKSVGREFSFDPEEILPVVQESLVTYGHLASLAEEEMKTGPVQGTMTFRTLFIDAFSRAAGLE